MTQSSLFWDRIAPRYSRKPVPDEAVYQEKLAVTRKYLQPDMEVMEIGCGTGSTSIAHSPYVSHILATDISGKMIEIAREKAAAEGIENVTFEQRAIEDLSVQPKSLDAVLALSILHLLEDKETAISHIHKMLKPGGVFVSSTACLGDTMKFFKYIGPIGKFLRLIPLVKVFTVPDLVDSITNDGQFEIEHQWQPKKGDSVYIVARRV
jgi:ubiquinone/menaquinone biosynthesis C-methylase UbiE